jgi:hypothetical protein
MHKVWRARPGYDAAFDHDDDHKETCMQFASIVAAAGIGLGCCNAAIGQGEQASWQEAQSLRELPPGIQVLLGVGLGAHDGGIADRGEPFNGSDVVMLGTPPQRRFALGILGSDTVVVAVERGGIGKWVQTLEFRQTGATWEAVRCAASSEVPRHGEQLLEALVAHPRHDWIACGLPGAERPADMPTAPAAPMAPAAHR